jgi:hypothetical protein
MVMKYADNIVKVQTVNLAVCHTIVLAKYLSAVIFNFLFKEKMWFIVYVLVTWHWEIFMHH